MRTNGPRWSGQVVASHNHDLAAVAEHVDTFGARSNVALVDGLDFVSNIEEAIRIRTGESGLDAI